jgi:hypothetical protein
MQPYIYEADSTSTPNGIGGVREAGTNATLTYTPASEMAGAGPIGRYASQYDWAGQARTFWVRPDGKKGSPRLRQSTLWCTVLWDLLKADRIPKTLLTHTPIGHAR